MDYRQRRFGALCVWLSAAAVSACGAGTVRQHFTENALDRAAFEMHCPKDQIQLVQLGRALDSSMVSGIQVGVQGCGRQAVYVFANETGWVLNSATGGGSPGAQ